MAKSKSPAKKTMPRTQEKKPLEPIVSVPGVAELVAALQFYADPGVYHAITILADRPAGEFADDFSEDHGDEFYDRPMPGKLARDTLKKLGLNY